MQINGTGETSRDFCDVANVVQANLLAATVRRQDALGETYNVAVGQRTTLLELYQALRSRLLADHAGLKQARPTHAPFRPGDVMHSLADIGKAGRLLGYEPTDTLERGLDATLTWYREQLG